MTAAELAVGIAGFTAIAIALGRLNADNARDQLDIFTMLSIPLIALICSLLPVTLVYLTVSPSIALRVSSTAMVVFAVAWYVYGYSRPNVERRPETPFTIGLSVCAVANTLAQLSNATLLSGDWHFGVYFAGLAWLEVAAVAVLLYTIQVRSAA
jgi:hypothetical protein